MAYLAEGIQGLTDTRLGTMHPVAVRCGVGLYWTTHYSLAASVASFLEFVHLTLRERKD